MNGNVKGLGEDNIIAGNLNLDKDKEVASSKLRKSSKVREYTEEEKENKADMLPADNYIMILPYKDNPYSKSVVSDSGVITGLGDMKKEKDPMSGETLDAQDVIKVGQVVEVGPMVKYVRKGDEIYYTSPSAYPLPFFGLGYQVVREGSVLAVINEGLQERWKSLK